MLHGAALAAAVRNLHEKLQGILEVVVTAWWTRSDLRNRLPGIWVSAPDSLQCSRHPTGEPCATQSTFSLAREPFA
jgi:hypothetical protein